MRLQYFAGERAAALSQFRICRDVLERELGVEPDVETLALHQALVEGKLERPAPSAKGAARSINGSPSPPHPTNGVASPRLAARLTSAGRRNFVGRTGEMASF